MRIGISLLLSLLLVSVCDGFVRISNGMPLLRYMRGRSRTMQCMRAKVAKPADPHPKIVQPRIEGQDSTLLERLLPDTQDLIEWVEKHGGEFKADIALEKEGWSLASQSDAPANSVLVRIPKKLCIFADAPSLGSSLLEGTSLLMGSLQTSQWRARLAIAMMSERARPESFFFPYLRNLPVEFLGMPLFYTEAEIMQSQEPGVMHRTAERIRFLSEFSKTVLTPLKKTPLDPFSGQDVTLDHLVWGFATATSRALRNIQTPEDFVSMVNSKRSVVDTSTEMREQEKCHEEHEENNILSLENKPDLSTQGPVMVPAIDLATHSLTPSCAVRDTGDAFVLYTLRAVKAGEGLTIHYGALSNDELLDDYGFTIDNNPYDRVLLDLDQVMLNAARSVVGQSEFASFAASAETSDTFRDSAESDGVNWIPGDEPASPTTDLGGASTPSMALASKETNPNRHALVRKVSRSKQQVVRQESLQDWQQVWLACLGLQKVLESRERMYLGHIPAHIVNSTATRDVAESDALKTQSRLPELVTYNPQVDPRLLAFLRILYTPQESDLLSHGFDPYQLQLPGSLLSTPQEAQVVRTVLGMLSIIARYFDTTLAQDLRLLKDNIAPGELDTSAKDCIAQEEDKASASAVPSRGAATAESIKAECRSILRSVLRARQLARTTTASAGDRTKAITESETSRKEPKQSLMHPRVTRDGSARPLAFTSPQEDGADSESHDCTASPTTRGQTLFRSLHHHAAHRDVVFMQKATSNQHLSGKLSNNEDELVNFAHVQRWGEKLSVNTREAYKYRIRRKKLVWDLMAKFTGIYELLVQQTGALGTVNKHDTTNEVTNLALALSGAAARNGGHSTLPTAKTSATGTEQKEKQPRGPPAEEEQALLRLRQLSNQWATNSNL